MKLMRYRPVPLEGGTWPFAAEVPSRFRRLFEDFLGGAPALESIGWNPVVDIIDADGELLLTAELPGLRKEDVQLEIEDGILTLRGEKKEEKEKKEKAYHLVERSYGAFERCFTLPRSVDPAKVKAEFADGVLEVHMPKTEQAVGKKIEIAAK